MHFYLNYTTNYFSRCAVICLLLASLAFSGCADVSRTQQEGVGLGAVLGAGTGALIGALTKSRNGVLVGALVGAATGAYAGHEYASHVEKRRGKYARSEDDADQQFARSRALSAKVAADNARTQRQIAIYRNRVRQLNADYQNKAASAADMRTCRAELEQRCRELAAERSRVQDALDAQRQALAQARQKNDQANTAALEKEVESLSKARDTLRNHEKELLQLHGELQS